MRLLYVTVTFWVIPVDKCPCDFLKKTGSHLAIIVSLLYSSITLSLSIRILALDTFSQRLAYATRRIAYFSQCMFFRTIIIFTSNNSQLGWWHYWHLRLENYTNRIVILAVIDMYLVSYYSVSWLNLSLLAINRYWSVKETARTAVS